MYSISKLVSNKGKIRKVGNSLVITLNRGALQVYDLKENDDVEIEYKYPEILIRKAKQEGEK